VFVSEPVHNVIHREVLERDGVGFTSHRAVGEEQSEFLSSTDNWFRPVTLRTGPDGALYFADMYRFVIEHPEWISPEMQARVDLRAGSDKGRLYRVVPEGRPRRRIPNLAAMTSQELVKALNSSNGWQRDMAQRLLIERNEPVSREMLGELTTLTHPPQVRIQALSTMGLLRALTPETVVAALADPHPAVRCEALRQSEAFTANSESVFNAVAAEATDSDAAVRMQAAFTLGAWPSAQAEPVLRELAARSDTDELIRISIMSSLSPESPLFTSMNQSTPIPKSTAPAIALKPSSSDRAEVIARYAGVEKLTGDKVHGRMLYQTNCATCHRLRGDGNEVGPDLGMVGNKPVDWLLTAILDPSQAIEARYRAWNVTTKSGEELAGLISVETANNLVLRVAGGNDRAILREDISAMTPLKLSLMPTGFEAALTPQDMADLLGWLRSP
jgi:putative heme-binding domain-containing protein